jgi:hypothetical protein
LKTETGLELKSLAAGARNFLIQKLYVPIPVNVYLLLI